MSDQEDYTPQDQVDVQASQAELNEDGDQDINDTEAANQNPVDQEEILEACEKAKELAETIYEAAEAEDREALVAGALEAIQNYAQLLQADGIKVTIVNPANDNGNTEQQGGAERGTNQALAILKQIQADLAGLKEVIGQGDEGATLFDLVAVGGGAGLGLAEQPLAGEEVEVDAGFKVDDDEEVEPAAEVEDEDVEEPEPEVEEEVIEVEEEVEEIEKPKPKKKKRNKKKKKRVVEEEEEEDEPEEVEEEIEEVEEIVEVKPKKKKRNKKKKKRVVEEEEDEEIEEEEQEPEEEEEEEQPKPKKRGGRGKKKNRKKKRRRQEEDEEEDFGEAEEEELEEEEEEQPRSRKRASTKRGKKNKKKKRRRDDSEEEIEEEDEEEEEDPAPRRTKTRPDWDPEKDPINVYNPGEKIDDDLKKALTISAFINHDTFMTAQSNGACNLFAEGEIIHSFKSSGEQKILKLD